MVRPDLSLWGYRNTCFLVALCCLIIRTGDQEASPSANKKLGVLLVPCWSWKSVPTSISNGLDISKVLICHLLWQMSSQWVSQKLLQGLVFTNLFLSLEWQYYQRGVNHVNRNNTTLWNLALPIFEVFIQLSLNVNLSLNQTLLAFLPSVRQTLMTQLILAISLWGFLFL